MTSEQMPERIWAWEPDCKDSGYWGNDPCFAEERGATEYIRADLVRETKREALEDFYRRLQQHQEVIVSDAGPSTLKARVGVWKRAQAVVAGVMNEMRKELDRE